MALFFCLLTITPPGGVMARAIKIARTISDLAGSENIETAHIAEAAGLKSLVISCYPGKIAGIPAISGKGY